MACLFLSDLWKLVDANYPWFAFLNPCDIRFHFYNGLAAAYSRVLKSSKLLKKRGDACTATVQLWKLKQVDMAVIDLLAFVGGVDSFAYMVDVDYSAIMAQPHRLSRTISELKKNAASIGISAT